MPYADINERRRVSREYQARRYAEHRPEDEAYARAAQQKKRGRLARFLKAVKVTAGCIDCGYDEHPNALQFDHHEAGHVKMLRDGKSWVKVIAHLLASDVRCANCHAIRTWG